MGFAKFSWAAHQRLNPISWAFFSLKRNRYVITDISRINTNLPREKVIKGH